MKHLLNLVVFGFALAVCAAGNAVQAQDETYEQCSDRVAEYQAIKAELSATKQALDAFTVDHLMFLWAIEGPATSADVARAISDWAHITEQNAVLLSLRNELKALEAEFIAAGCLDYDLHL